MRLVQLFGEAVVQPGPLKRIPKSLYHGSKALAVASMLVMDQLYEGAHWGRENEPHGPRFATSFKGAKGWMEHDFPPAMIVLSGPSLAQKYKLIPYLDVDANGDPWPNEEVEIVVETKTIRPLAPHIVKLIARDADIKKAMDPEEIEFAKAEYIGNRSIKWCQQALTILANHPKRVRR